MTYSITTSVMTLRIKTVIIAFSMMTHSSIMTHSIITSKMTHSLMAQHYNKHNGTQYDDTALKQSIMAFSIMTHIIITAN